VVELVAGGETVASVKDGCFIAARCAWKRSRHGAADPERELVWLDILVGCDMRPSCCSGESLEALNM